MNDSDQVRQLIAADVPSAASGLASAFEHDAFYAWLVPDPVKRLPGLTEYFSAKLTRGLAGDSGWLLITRSTSTVLIGERVTGSAGSDSPALPSGSRDVLGRWVSAAHLERISDVFEAITHPPYNHVYLDILATVPAAQGRGEGSALARLWLESIRAGTQHVHLDSSSPQNIPFYQRLGFSAGPAVTLPHGAGHLTPMDLDFS